MIGWKSRQGKEKRDSGEVNEYVTESSRKADRENTVGHKWPMVPV